MHEKNYSAKEYSILMEKEVQRVHDPTYRVSDDILLNPYQAIVSAVEYRISKEKLDRFKLNYQGIDGKTLQTLINNGYDIMRLLNDLQDMFKDC